MVKHCAIYVPQCLGLIPCRSEVEPLVVASVLRQCLPDMALSQDPTLVKKNLMEIWKWRMLEWSEWNLQWKQLVSFSYFRQYFQNPIVCKNKQPLCNMLNVPWCRSQSSKNVFSCKSDKNFRPQTAKSSHPSVAARLQIQAPIVFRLKPKTRWRNHSPGLAISQCLGTKA